MARDLDAPADDRPWPAPRLAWTALAMLMVGMVISVLDRGIITILVEPMKAAYGLSDTQFGALTGLAFGLLYVCASIPIGFLADRYQRRILVGIGMTIFSLFSVSTGLAKNYALLFLSRMGVGLGEAAMSPVGLSLISDYFPREKLGRAISLFMMSTYVGASLALVAGGALVAWYDRVAASNPDALLGLAPWQATIITVALPGLLLAPLFFLLREPPRRGLIAEGRRLSLREIAREFGRRRQAMALLVIGMSMASIMTQAVSIWTPTLFIRVYQWSPAKTGLWLGILILIGAVAGSYLSGWLTDRLTRQSKSDAPITVAALSFIGVGIFGVAAPLMPSGELALLCFLPVWFLKPMAFCCGPIAVQMMMPNQVRGQASGVYFTTLNLAGIALGPVVVGALSDNLFNFPGGMRYSLVVITAVTVPLMILLMMLARRPYRALLG